MRGHVRGWTLSDGLKGGRWRDCVGMGGGIGGTWG